MRRKEDPIECLISMFGRREKKVGKLLSLLAMKFSGKIYIYIYLYA